MQGMEDDLGPATGGGPYPVKKPRPPCQHGCGRLAAPRRKVCEACRSRTPAKAIVRRKHRGVYSGVGTSITPAEWQAIWRQQGGLCPICLTPLRNRYDQADHTPRVAALDHDHEVESSLKKQGVEAGAALRASVRGLLCTYPCNRLFVRHWTAQRLENAARYQREHPAQRVLRG